MAMVQPKSLKYRVWATHVGMWIFLGYYDVPIIDGDSDFFP